MNRNGPGQDSDPNSNRPTYPVLIAGGGPVGLYLALVLVKSGVACRVLEKRTGIDPHSRSLGIHPVSLDLFDELGITDSFLRNGVKIRRGHAYTGKKKSGTIHFETCPRPHNYILALPQYLTEMLLEHELHRTDPACLIRGAEVTSIRWKRNSVEIKYLQEGETRAIAGYWLAGCDGKNSLVRTAANIDFAGKPYPDTYIMGDFTDNTSFGCDAAVYLHPSGLIESFPLPGGARRWVVKTDEFVENPDRTRIEQLVRRRIGYDISETENRMVSSFGVQHYMASTFCKGRCLLAGDSAHIISPIGGQGMNLGWLTARYLAGTLLNLLDQPGKMEMLLHEFSTRSRRIARQAANRAEVNMWLGRKHKVSFFRSLIVSAMVNSPLQYPLAKIFTMRGLGAWPV